MQERRGQPVPLEEVTRSPSTARSAGRWHSPARSSSSARRSRGSSRGCPAPPLPITAAAARPSQIYPTIGTRAVLRPASSPSSAPRTRRGARAPPCDPAVSQGQEFTAFINGCEPWYGVNPFNERMWWNPRRTRSAPTRACGSARGRCHPPTASTRPQLRGSACRRAGYLQRADGQLDVASRPENCSNIQNNSCQNVVTATTTATTTASPVTRTAGPAGRRRRRSARRQPVHRSRTSRSRACPVQRDAPSLGFASFYVMDWTGNNAGQSDPCPDPDFRVSRRCRRSRRAPSGRLRRGRRLRARPRRSKCDLRRGPADSLPGNARPLICRY